MVLSKWNELLKYINIGCKNLFFIINLFLCYIDFFFLILFNFDKCCILSDSDYF